MPRLGTVSSGRFGGRLGKNRGLVASGGTVSYIAGYAVHTFTASDTFTVSSGKGSVEYLLVGGGGGGGMDMGGGGGGGGVVAGTTICGPGTYAVAVGLGGAGAPAAGTNGQPSGHPYTINAKQGGSSSVFDTTAFGGGYGGSSYFGYALGGIPGMGGSGGGASGFSNGTTTRGGGVAVDEQGYVGGSGGVAQYYSGGGGGAGGQGANAPAKANGGNGVVNSINGTAYYWGGGGGGSGHTIGGGDGGLGGGGGGAVGNPAGAGGTGGINAGSAGTVGVVNSQANVPGGNGGANTGGGGGGGSHYNSNNKGGDGGSGIVVIRYKFYDTPVADFFDKLSATARAALLAAYSFRRVVPGYSGPIARLRRSSDNAETDFDDIGDIAAWQGSSTVFVVTLFDQSGRGKHLTQGTAAGQPQLVFRTGETAPSAYFTGSQFLVCPTSVFPNANVTDMHIVCTTREVVRVGNHFIQMREFVDGQRVSTHMPWESGNWYWDAGDMGMNRSAAGGETNVGSATVFSAYKSSAQGKNAFRLNGGTRAESSGHSAVSSSKFSVGGGGNHDFIEGMIFSQRLGSRDESIVESGILRPFSPSDFSGLVGWYDGLSWTGTQWTDKSGVGNHAVTLAGTFSTASRLNGGVVVSGSTTSKITFPVAILPATYTLFHVARYTGPSRGRIFVGGSSNTDWLSGFWGGASGVAYHIGWMTPQSASIHGDDWVLSSDQNALYRSNGTNRTQAAPGTPSYARLTVNAGVNQGGAITAEVSDFAIAEIIVFNRTLTLSEILRVEAYLATRYAIAQEGGRTGGQGRGDVLGATLVAGLAGKFFAGSFRAIIGTGDIGTLPLTADVSYGASGVTLYSAISYPTQGDEYGFIAIGYFTPPTTGTYTFYTSSDDGSGVWIGSTADATSGRTAANAVLNNNLGGGQADTKRSGTIDLTAGVRYAIRIVQEDGDGGDNLTFSWSGPGIAETTALGTYFSTYRKSDSPLQYDYLRSSPALPVTSGLVMHLDAYVHTAGQSVWVDQTGNYNFNVNSAALTTAGGVTYMDFGGTKGIAKRVVGGVLTNVPNFGMATVIAFTRVSSVTSDWRTLLRGAAADHQIIIEVGSNNLGMWDGSFSGAGYDVTPMVNQWTMGTWKLSTSAPYYQFGINAAPESYNIYAANATFDTGFATIGGGTGATPTDVNSAAQYWGGVSLVLYYNRELSTSEIEAVYDAYSPRYGLPARVAKPALPAGLWTELSAFNRSVVADGANSRVVSWGSPLNFGQGVVAQRPAVDPTYDAVSFTRAAAQFLDGGPRTLNISTNGGFTAVVQVRFTGAAGLWERVFDFNSGGGVDNVLLCRQNTSSSMRFQIWNGGGIPLTLDSQAAITQNELAVYVARYRKSDNSAHIYKNGQLIASATGIGIVTDRTLSTPYIGRSPFSSDEYLNAQIRGMYVWDRALTDAEIFQVSNQEFGIPFRDLTGTWYDGSNRMSMSTIHGSGSGSFNGVTYRYLRWEIVKRRAATDPSPSCIQVSWFRVKNGGTYIATVPTATNPGGSSPAGESPSDAVDAAGTSTKWLDFNFSTSTTLLTGSSILVLDYSSKVVFDSYSWYTANDGPFRDPTSWVLSGSTTSTSGPWVVLSTVNDNATTTTRITEVPVTMSFRPSFAVTSTGNGSYTMNFPDLSPSSYTATLDLTGTILTLSNGTTWTTQAP